MKYRFNIQGRYFLVAVFVFNIIALLPFGLIVTDPVPHENAVRAGIMAFTGRGDWICHFTREL